MRNLYHLTCTSAVIKSKTVSGASGLTTHIMCNVVCRQHGAGGSVSATGQARRKHPAQCVNNEHDQC